MTDAPATILLHQIPTLAANPNPAPNLKQLQRLSLPYTFDKMKPGAIVTKP